jgi:hypothetical protein
MMKVRGLHRGAKNSRLRMYVSIKSGLALSVLTHDTACPKLGARCHAGAVVTHSVEPYAIVAGVPTRKIGTRNLSAMERECPLSEGGLS